MISRERTERIAELRETLAKLDAQLREQMRKRGFDPAQAANIALPSALAQLLAKRDEMSAELEELITEETE